MKAKVDKLLLKKKSSIQNDVSEAELPPSSMVMGPKTPLVKPKNLILHTKSCSPAIQRPLLPTPPIFDYSNAIRSPLLPTPQTNEQLSFYKPKKKKGSKSKIKMKAQADKLSTEEKSSTQNDVSEAERPYSSIVLGPKTPLVNAKDPTLQTKVYSYAIQSLNIPSPQKSDHSYALHYMSDNEKDDTDSNGPPRNKISLHQ